MTKFLGLRKVYDVDQTKPFMVADVLEDGAILPHSVLLSDLPVLTLEADTEIVENEKPQCVCYEYMGDNLDCPIHGLANQEGCDSSMLGQLTAAGFGSGGVL